MADLSIQFAGIRSPNPFWLASAPPANSGAQVHRAFEAGWGGAVWKTVGAPVLNVSNRYGAWHYGSQRMLGINNVELISDRPLETNLREIAEVKRAWRDHAVIVSAMVESTPESWHEIIRKIEDTGADGIELNYGCPHGMSERGMGAAVGQVPEYCEQITRWVTDVVTAHSGNRKTDAQHHEYRQPRSRRHRRRSQRPLAHQHAELDHRRGSRHLSNFTEYRRQRRTRRLCGTRGQTDRAEYALLGCD